MAMDVQRTEDGGRWTADSGGRGIT